MTHAERVKLWDAVNDYAKSCGGNTSSETIKTDRCVAVSAVETVVREIIDRVRRQEAEDIVASVLT